MSTFQSISKRSISSHFPSINLKIRGLLLLSLSLTSQSILAQSSNPSQPTSVANPATTATTATTANSATTNATSTTSPTSTTTVKTLRIQPKSEDLNQARLLYEERCVQCHGSNGNGNGNLSEHLQPRPRNFQSKDWQRQVSDIEIKRVIIGGGGAVQKSVLMPANPDLRGKPKLIEALIYLIRTFDLSNQLDESQLPLNQGPTE